MSDTKNGRFRQGHALCASFYALHWRSTYDELKKNQHLHLLPLITLAMPCHAVAGVAALYRCGHDIGMKERAKVQHRLIRMPRRPTEASSLSPRRVGENRESDGLAWAHRPRPAGVTSKPVVETKVHFSPRF